MAGEMVRVGIARALVAFGAACLGMFSGFVGCAVLVVPVMGPTPSSQDFVAAVAIGLGVAGAVASLAVSVEPFVSPARQAAEAA